MGPKAKTLPLFTADTRAIYIKAAIADGEPLSLLRIYGPLPDDGIFEIIDLMRIPSNKRADAALGMLSFGDWIFSHREGGGSLIDNIKHFDRIASLCDRLLKELDIINAAGRTFLEFRCAANGADNIFSLRQYRAATQSLMRNVTFVKRKRAAHRPKGAVKNPELKALVLELYRLAKKYDGRLTLGLDMRTHKSNGSLPKILRIIHQHFPKIIPTEVPYHTLHRMRCAAIDHLAREASIRDRGPPPPSAVNPKSTA
jgi:hypothetical protein